MEHFISMGTLPEWVTALAALGSLKYLIDYAKAAREQVRISERQIEISQEQIRVSQAQIKISQAQIEVTELHTREQMRPILVMSSLEAVEGLIRFTMQNQGGGAAFDIRWQMLPNQNPDHQFGSQTFVLGPGAVFTGTLENEGEVNLLFFYVSAFGKEHRSEVHIQSGNFTTRYFPNSGTSDQRVIS